MKKQIIAILTAVFILVCLAACGSSDMPESGGSMSSVADDSESNSDSGAADDSESDSHIKLDVSDNGGTEPGGAKDESLQDDSTEKVRYIYGETAIPDIPCGDGGFEGKANLVWEGEDSVKLQQSLDSMVFETHTFGDYTVRLVGDQVRTDEANFPGSIYTQNLRVEVEKNGVLVEEDGQYNNTITYLSQFLTEYRLFADKIGEYLGVYDLDYPVIAMKYYYDDAPERTVMTAVEFAVIRDNEFCSGFVGVFEEGLGVMLNFDGDGTKPGTMLMLNSTDNQICRMGIFSSNKFTVADGKTLIDEEAGIKYTFDFSDPLPFELYTAEKIQ